MDKRLSRLEGAQDVGDGEAERNAADAFAAIALALNMVVSSGGDFADAPILKQLKALSDGDAEPTVKAAGANTRGRGRF